ncbi:McrB family protein [Romboutsia sp. 1001285H_161024_C4]|uniref:McrB family protein n=1 Tax=Romboutsia sp. 1001285H_161024_C4 TaxID=2787109 RepID=UPI001898B7D9|nr:AAA family ATPase [Romboutsia sp. 1001285H_161024_C4]
MLIPKLNIQPKPSTVNKYSEYAIANTIYNFLFSKTSYRKIDEDILGLDSKETRGYQSMGIMRHYGLVSDHQNLFNKCSIDKAIDILTKQDEKEYKNIVDKLKLYKESSNSSAIEYESTMNIKDFKMFCLDKGFYYEDRLIRRFILSLETKPFLILTGISGSGKTKIAELWIEYKKIIYKDGKDRSVHVSVGSNWNDNKKLLGFKNILLEGDNSYSDTEVVKIIRDSNKEKDRQYIIILDEMNLSHVERYFADFLSALESRSKEIKLPNGEIIRWSKNLKIIGTVNVDETTYMFSPKVLDRANVIEMNGKKPSEYINSVKDSQEKIYKDIKSESWFGEYIANLDRIYEAVKEDFGFRVVDEVSQYIKINTDLFSEENFNQYFDEQVCQKILPKLHGAKAALKPKLDSLQMIFAGNEDYKLTNNKLEEMQNSVKKGYTSFIGE